MVDGRLQRRLQNANDASRELEQFALEYSGPSKELVMKVIKILKSHRAYKYFCEQKDLNYESMSDITERKRGCQLDGFDDLLTAIGYDIRLVKRS